MAVAPQVSVTVRDKFVCRVGESTVISQEDESNNLLRSMLAATLLWLLSKQTHDIEDEGPDTAVMSPEPCRHPWHPPYWKLPLVMLC